MTRRLVLTGNALIAIPKGKQHRRQEAEAEKPQQFADDTEYLGDTQGKARLRLRGRE